VQHTRREATTSDVEAIGNTTIQAFNPSNFDVICDGMLYAVENFHAKIFDTKLTHCATEHGVCFSMLPKSHVDIESGLSDVTSIVEFARYFVNEDKQGHHLPETFSQYECFFFGMGTQRRGWRRRETRDTCKRRLRVFALDARHYATLRSASQP